MSRCFEYEAKNATILQYLGGVERAENLNAMMQDAETDLSRCPFCGGFAEMVGIMAYTQPGVRVRCRRCGSSTPPVYEGVSFIMRPYMAKKTLTLEQAIERAVEIWEQREGSAAV